MRSKSSPLTFVSEFRIAKSRDDRNPAENLVSLQRASKVLHGIRDRYQREFGAQPGARAYSMRVAVDAGDIEWITAAIECVERVLAANRGGATHRYPPSRTKAPPEKGALVGATPLLSTAECPSPDSKGCESEQ